MERSRRFCFTLNNYQAPEVEALDRLFTDSTHVEYAVYGYETAPNTQTRHLQGYVFFKKKHTLGAVIALLPRAHVEVAKGNHQQNHDYCTKGGIYDSFGTFPKEPGEHGKDYWAQKKLQILDRTVDDADPKFSIQYHQTIRSIQRENPLDLAILSPTTAVGEWIWGPSGVGKTRSVWERHTHVYPKNLNKWWDGYDDNKHTAVLLDDVDPASNKDGWLDRYMKIWMDIYPFMAEVKGGSKMIRPKIFIVTSQFRPDQIFTNEENLRAVMRRMRVRQILPGLPSGKAKPEETIPGTQATCMVSQELAKKVDAHAPTTIVNENSLGSWTEMEEWTREQLETGFLYGFNE